MELFCKVCEKEGATGDSLVRLALDVVGVQTSEEQDVMTVPSLFVVHNRKVACHGELYCFNSDTTCQLRHWDYCVQYYLFGRCGCTETTYGHISREMLALVAEVSPDRLREMWSQFQQEQAAAEAVRIAAREQEMAIWHEHAKRSKDEQDKLMADFQASINRRNLEDHRKKCQEREALVATLSIVDFLRLTTRPRCPHDGVGKILVNFSFDKPLHNVKRERGCYAVCSLCLRALVDARPQDLAFINLIPSRTISEASEHLLVHIHFILQQLATYKKFYKTQCTQELARLGVCQDVASLVLSFL
jgi:hypothetical protein